MKVIQLKYPLEHDDLDYFIRTIQDKKLTPMFFIALDEKGEPVLYTSKMSWKEFAYCKMGFDMYAVQEWNS